MKLTIELDEKMQPVVSEAGFLKDNIVCVKLGDIEITMTEQQATELYEGIEKALWDEAYHSNNLEKEVEQLESRVTDLEYYIANMGMEVPV